MFASDNDQRRGDHKHNVAHIFCRRPYDSIQTSPPRNILRSQKTYINRSWNDVQFEQCEYSHGVGKRYRHKATAPEFPPKIFSSCVFDEFNAQKGKTRTSNRGWDQVERHVAKTDTCNSQKNKPDQVAVIPLAQETVT